MSLPDTLAGSGIVGISAGGALAVLALLLRRRYGGVEEAGDPVAAATCMTFTGLLVPRAAGAGIFGDAR
jgi:hypothetical protein